MRKPRRLTVEELVPFQWQMPRTGGRRLAASGESVEVGEPRPSPPAPIDWQGLFGNPNPIEVEVGMGKGLFLLNAAQTRPDTNFFGIEIARKYQLYATTRFAVRGLTNVKTVCADAKWVFRQFVSAGSVATVHVYFPDPWWKARHKKRRVFSPEFAANAARVIATGGRLLIATDVEEYFGVMTGIVRAMPAFLEIATETSSAPVEEAGFQTNFERKARLKGTSIWRAVYERTTNPVAVVPDEPTA